MHLSVKNIGKLSEADIDLNGITVIAGENDTGKSTIGKVLYSVFNIFNNIDKQVEEERKRFISRYLINVYDYPMEELVKNIINSKDDETIKNLLLNTNITIRNNDINLDEVVDIIKDSLLISENDIKKMIIKRRLSAEFNENINNIYSEDKAEINLTIKSQNIAIYILNNDVVNIFGKDEFSLNNNVIYIDDPNILDEIEFYKHFYNNYLKTREIQLVNTLFPNKQEGRIIEEIFINQKLDDIMGKINSVCSGSIIEDKINYNYKIVNSDKVINIKNLSTGLKSFVILKTLLQNGAITYNGTIILDEPEIHLHPQWQLLFAEIIVLLQKEFKLHVLLTTHSPYFIEAIETYSEKYSIANNCNYYLAENYGESASIFDVTNNTEEIYKKLAKPFQELENARYSDD